MNPIDYPIDENGSLRLALTPSEDGQHIHARLYSQYGDNSKLVKNILHLVSFESKGQTIKPSESTFDIPTPTNGTAIALKINGHDFASFEVKDDQIDASSTRKLCVFETRMIGRAKQKEVPEETALEVPEDLMPITDLHTHLSMQVSAEDLIALGIEYNLTNPDKEPIAYPVDILRKLKVTEYPKDKLVKIPKRPFLPLGIKPEKGELEDAVPVHLLSKEAQQALQSALSFSTATQNTFADMEEQYYMREPFTKDIRLFPGMLRKVAEAYAKQGIEYAELSSNAITDPRWLKIIHEELPRYCHLIIDIGNEVLVKVDHESCNDHVDSL